MSGWTWHTTAVVAGLTAATLLGASPAAAATCPTSPKTAQAAADAYLAALTSHDASAVPFAADVLRVENGLVTGRSAEGIRTDLNTSVKYRIITGLRDRQYTAGPGRVDVRYRLDVGFTAPVVGTVRVVTVSVNERFDVTCGRITFIKATISPA
ncbi:hypothetical protein ACIB24_09675 [Spongisporangium articulatum]|uniref:DUF8021 domain-containing protein n=1 Tax=Spongisporangium articulatum TaxID=3362603 RepID=A0ABW8ALS8_9ACTN